MNASSFPTSVISTARETPRASERSSTRGNLALVAFMPISFALTVLLIVALRS